jgi:hypothetical protein
MMMFVMVFTPMRMAVLVTVLFVVGGMLVGVPMMSVLVRMVMLVFVSAAHLRSSCALVSERSPLWGLYYNLGKGSEGTCQSASTALGAISKMHLTKDKEKGVEGVDLHG